MRDWFAIREAKKSYYPPSASWRPKNTDGAIPVQPQRPRNQGSQWCKSLSMSESPRARSADS